MFGLKKVELSLKNGKVIYVNVCFEDLSNILEFFEVLLLFHKGFQYSKL